MNNSYKDSINTPEEYLKFFINYYERFIVDNSAKHMMPPYEVTKMIYESVKIGDIVKLKSIYQKYELNAEELGTGFQQVIKFLGRYLENSNKNT